jgi:hypothetical protein
MTIREKNSWDIECEQRSEEGLQTALSYLQDAMGIHDKGNVFSNLLIDAARVFLTREREIKLLREALKSVEKRLDGLEKNLKR